MPNQLFARIADEPVLVHTNRAEWVAMTLSALSTHPDYRKLHSPEAEKMAGQANDGYWPEAGSWLAYYRPYNVVNGVLQVPVKGMLMHGLSYAFGDYATGYDYIWKAIDRGMSDYQVRGIALIIDSNGGEVAGNFDLVDKIYSLRGQKPIEAFVNESAYSAAYSIASVCDKIHVTRTAGVGSIGVVTSHVSYADAMKESGIEVTFIYAGKHKVDGNAYEKLSPDVKARIQSRIDGMYDIFTSTVARNRGMTVDAVKGTEALCYTGQDGITAGLADSIKTFGDALQSFSDKVNKRSGVSMTTQTKENPSAIQASAEATYSAADLEAAKKEGATAERGRILAIVGADEAKGRTDLANHLAFNTEMSVDAVKGILAASPTAAITPQKDQASAFEEAMANSQNPNVRADVVDDAEDAGTDTVAAIVGDWHNARGIKK